MSERVAELAGRLDELKLRSAAQRAAIASEVETIEARFGAVDRLIGVARSTLLHPAVIAAGVVALLTVGRARGLQLIGRALLLGAAARRLLRAAKRL